MAARVSGLVTSVLSAALLLGCGTAAAVERRAVAREFPSGIALRVDRGGWSDMQPVPLGFGVPLKPGQVHDLARLGVATGSGGLVPAAFEARTRWPDGSVQWLWADVAAPLTDSLLLLLDGRSAPAPTPGVTVVQDASAIVVENGALAFTFDRVWAAPRRVDVRAPDGGVRLAGEGDGAGVYLIDQRGVRGTLGGSNAALEWRVETASPLRAVVRVEGFFTDERGDRLARAVMRYHFDWGQPGVRIEHTFIVTRPSAEVTYREIAVQLPIGPRLAPVARVARVGDPVYVVPLDAPEAEAWIFQRRWPHLDQPEAEYWLGNGVKTLATGAEAGGWIDVNDGDTGLQVVVRDFAASFPKELAAGPRSVTAKLWSARSGILLDHRPAALIRDFWGADWVANIAASPSNAGSAADLAAYSPSNVGTARTHQILAVYSAAGYDPRLAYARARGFQQPPLVHPDPRWVLHVDPAVVWPMAAEGEGGDRFAEVERLGRAWFDEHMVPLALFPYAGWFDLGKLPDLRYERDPDGTVYAQWTRLNNLNAYFIVKHLLLGWVRSGERAYLEAASRHNRLVADTTVVRFGGVDGKVEGRLTNDGRAHLPVYWAGNGIFHGLSSREPLFGFALEYLLRDSRWLRDSLEQVADAMLAAFDQQRAALGPSPSRPQRQRAVNAIFRCDPYLGLSMLNSAYRVLQDPRLADDARFVLDATVNESDPGGLDAEYFQLARCSEGALYKPDRTIVTLIEHYDLLGDETARRAAILLAHVAASDRGQPISYQNLSGAWAARVFEWTGSVAMEEALRWQLDGARAVFGAYERLDEGARGSAHFVTVLGPIGQGGLAHYRYEFTGIEGFGSETAILDFSSPQNGVVFFALPAAIWALSGFPGAGEPPR